MEKTRAAATRKHNAALWKASQKWLQTEFPCQLAVTMSGKIATGGEVAKARFKTMIYEARQNNHFTHSPNVPELWEPNYDFLIRYGPVKPVNGGRPRNVRCGAQFDAFLSQEAPHEFGGTGGDSLRSLTTLLEACAPGSTRVFVNAHSFIRILHRCDYVLEKSFVFCIICLSKWLGQERFPQGLYGDWPPAPPPGALPALPPAPAEDEGDE